MVDLNADLGETPGDLEMMRAITSANVACGAHAGDIETMRQAVRAAEAARVVVGAHPSYADREGFGRRERGEEPAVVARQVAEQVSTLCSLGEVRYVKLHGALYHRANTDPEMAQAILLLLPVRHVLSEPGPYLEMAASMGFQTTTEGFCDRAYTPEGRLVDRSEPGAVLTDRLEVTAQAAALAGRFGSLCLHGDTPGAVELALSVREQLTETGVEVRAFAG